MMQFDLFYTNLDKLLYLCKKYDIISFDVFDTALIRMTTTPEEVFVIMSKRIGDPLFREKRIKAQKIAEAKYRKGTALANIYQEMAALGYVEETDQEEMIKKELEIEETICMPRVVIRDLIKKLSKVGKTIIFLSDMYIPGNDLELILRKKGFTGFQKVIVSCDIGKNKIDGDVYKHLKKLYPFQKILHIGDNIRTDYINAKKEIHSVLVRRIDGDIIDKLLMSSFRKNKSAYSWGYTIMSKIAYGFAMWIDRELKDSCIHKVLFLTREGAFFKEIFNLMGYEESYDSKLFYASRRSMLSALAAVDFSIMSEYILKTRCSVGELCKIFHLEDTKEKTLCRRYKIKAEDAINRVKNSEAIIKEVIKESQEYISEQYELLRDYICGFDLKGNVAVIDIGWNGTMQYLLGKLLERIDSSIQLTGYYLGEFTTQGLEYGIRKQGYLCNGQDNKSVTAVVNGAYVLEQCFTPDMGSVISYKREGGIVVPLLKENQQNNIILEIQNGITDAINEIRKYQGIAEFDLCKETLLEPIKYPDKFYAKILGDIRWSDMEDYRYIAKPESLTRYVISPKRAVFDLQKSGWKSAFLLRLFKLPLPYYKFYTMMKGFY